MNEEVAYRWRNGALQPVRAPQAIRLGELLGIDRQKQALVQNTLQFVAGLPANHALLSGSRGTGKSSMVKALLAEYAPQGLRMVEVPPHDLVDLPDIVAPLRERHERFILYVDDFSVAGANSALTALKTALDGGIEAPPDNVLVYATSNRRHLMPRDMMENERSTAINPSEAVEEKVSLSDRFGLWLGFHNCSQSDYLDMIDGYVEHYGLKIDEETLKAEAIEWAATRGSRSGRVAWQFIQDLAGRLGQTLG